MISYHNKTKDSGCIVYRCEIILFSNQDSKKEEISNRWHGSIRKTNDNTK